MTTTTIRTAAGPAVGGPRMAAAPILPTPRRRRRPALLAVGIVLAVVGGLAAYALAASMSTRTAVVVAAADIPWGATIAAADLVEADIAGDPVLVTVPWADRDSIIGQRAASDIHRGALIARADVTGAEIPPAGQVLVGVAVKPGQQPAMALTPSQKVMVVHTAADARTGTGADEPPVAAVVLVAGPADAAGGRIVDVLVDEADAALVAGWSASGAASILVVAGR